MKKIALTAFALSIAAFSFAQQNLPGGKNRIRVVSAKGVDIFKSVVTDNGISQTAEFSIKNTKLFNGSNYYLCPSCIVHDDRYNIDIYTLERSVKNGDPVTVVIYDRPEEIFIMSLSGTDFEIFKKF